MANDQFKTGGRRVKTIKPRLLPDGVVFANALRHAPQIVAALDTASLGAIAILFDDFCAEHPSTNRNLTRLFSESFPASAGRGLSIVDVPGQRWFFLSATQTELVRDEVMKILRRTGLIRLARVFVAESPRTLTSWWPMPGEHLDFSFVSLDLRPSAGLSASHNPATANEQSPAIAGNIARNRFTKLLQKLLLPLAHLKPSKGREWLMRRCKIRPINGH